MTKLPTKRRAKTNKLPSKKARKKPKKYGVTEAKKDAWEAFARMIKLRDAIKTTGTKDYIVCCTCGEVLELWTDREAETMNQSVHAGHYSQAPHEATRFDERNVNAQCLRCNKYRQGEQVLYRHFIIRTYGYAVEKEIWGLRQTIKRWKVDELVKIRDESLEEYEKMLGQKSYLREKYTKKIKRGERI